MRTGHMRHTNGALVAETTPCRNNLTNARRVRCPKLNMSPFTSNRQQPQSDRPSIQLQEVRDIASDLLIATALIWTLPFLLGAARAIVNVLSGTK